MIDIRNIPVADIETGQRLRQIDLAQVDRLKASILDVGLLNPITVYAIDETRFGLVAGGHRLEAYRGLSFEEIPASVVEFSDLERQLAECDENLCASKLTPVEEARFVARRKEVYEAIHPETVQGANLENARVARLATRAERAQRFTTDTAAKTGISERAVRRHAERGSKIDDEAMALIQGTHLDKGSYLDKLKGMAPERQLETAKQDLENRTDQRAIYGHLSGAVSQPRPGGIAGRIEAKRAPTYEEMRAAILLLRDLSAEDMTKICPPNKRAAMCQQLSALIVTFEQVKEGASA
jgi:ParB family chromosome partitioning protein